MNSPSIGQLHTGVKRWGILNKAKHGANPIWSEIIIIIFFFFRNFRNNQVLVGRMDQFAVNGSLIPQSSHGYGTDRTSKTNCETTPGLIQCFSRLAADGAIKTSSESRRVRTNDQFRINKLNYADFISPTVKHLRL